MRKDEFIQCEIRLTFISNFSLSDEEIYDSAK